MVHISDILRKLAFTIELDRTPTVGGVGSSMSNSSADRDGDNVKDRVVKHRDNDDEVSSDAIKPTARPKIKPPRRSPKSKPSNWDSKQHRREYMREWRSQGKDVETGNRYVKKRKRSK